MANEMLVQVLEQNLGFVQFHLADFSEADLLVRPVPGANHTAWQIGHLAASEAGMINTVSPRANIQLPAGWSDKFSQQTTKVDEASKLASKAEILDTFAKVRTATIAWVKSLTPEEMAQPTPERMQRFAQSVGHLAHMIAHHTTMHLGQVQVIRRKLGKPVLF